MSFINSCLKKSIQFVGKALLRIVYRVTVVDAEKMPKTGGLLLLPNHVTYMDAFVLSLASPRPVRFVMLDRFFEKAWVRGFANLFDTIPISSTKAKEALATAAAAAAEGSVVCIFPEGQLTRTGMLNEVKKGFELIARKADVPVMPVYMDGLWGSVFSFADGRFLTKSPRRVPYRVRVAFGNVTAAKEASAGDLRQEFSRLSAECYRVRNIRHGLRGNLIGDDLGSVKLYDLEGDLAAMSESQRDRLWRNAMQVADLHPVQDDDRALLVCEEGVPAILLGAILPKIARVKVDIIDLPSFQKLGADFVRSRSYNGVLGGESLRAMDLGDVAVSIFTSNLTPPTTNELTCVTQGDFILTGSFVDPACNPKQTHQRGHLYGSLGRVLPGFWANFDATTNTWRISGPALMNDVHLPAHLTINAESFVVPLATPEQPA